MRSVRRLVLFATLFGTLLIPEGLSGATIGGEVPGEVDPRVLASPTTGPVAVRGTLRGANGSRVRGRVAALAWPGEAMLRTLAVGDRVDTPTVGWAETKADGTFELSLDWGRIGRQYIGRNGVVNLKVVGWTATHQGAWHTSAYVATGARLASAQRAQPPAIGRVTVRADSPIHRAPGNRLTAGDRSVGFNVVICYNTLRSMHDAETVIGESWPYGAHTSYMTVDVNHTVKLGVATSATGAMWSWKASGSSTESTSIGSDFGGPSSAFRDYRIEMRYGRYQNNCGGAFTEAPMYETGGMWSTRLDSRDFPTAWSQCVRTSGNWWRASNTGSSYTLGAGVKVASVLGIDLSVDTSYATTRKLNYSFNGLYHVCGSNDVPSRASRLRSGP